MANDLTSQTPAKRRWYHNLQDAFRVTKRTYPWVGWVLALIPLVLVVLAIVVCLATSSPLLATIGWVVVALTAGAFIDTILLTRLLTQAMYRQIDGTQGAVQWVLSQIKRGWSIESEPVAMNRKQDLVWRLVGRPGIVLISEAPAQRAASLLGEEERKCRRVAQSVPVHTIQVGHGEGQVALKDLMRTLRKLPKSIAKDDVPLVAKRLESLRMRTQSIPRSVDPSRAKINRRMFRGR
ncbi:DUF4191 domain-containing protein [Nanchangia anserum]|uniref:DUF4191 domain-containing protein n=1 Tax=Nanchangia anserum TaxID=2692125 RepID=A0A8I0GD35_9ACTO|nr:DUF4191 domain-containing protein [Nanchangia anserum]MBD3688662.1 DUF4191 domain-containing protein [Nanchangia anserum]QOX82417.1 DUF4191 domain-containing protein [Nanchangia anserum]